jgi:hypothetical protein
VVSIDWPAWKDVGMLFDAVQSTSSPPSMPPGAPVNHPLFDERVGQQGGPWHYSTLCSPPTHWILDEHRIFGMPVIPGTAYVEMARAAVSEFLGTDSIELEDLFFLSPVAIRDHQQRSLRTTLERTATGASFRFSCLQQGSWRDVCIGHARAMTTESARHHDVQGWISRCTRRTIAHTADAPILDDNGARWKSLRLLHLGEHDLVARFELPGQFATDLDQYRLHPALLDRINLTAREHLATAQAAQNFYLPFTYQSVKIFAPLPRIVWAHVHFRTGESAVGAVEDTISFDTEITDEEGRELVRIRAFTQKRVADVATQMRTLSGEDLAAARAPGSAQAHALAQALEDGI